jgi:hypothetical protein
MRGTRGADSRSYNRLTRGTPNLERPANKGTTTLRIPRLTDAFKLLMRHPPGCPKGFEFQIPGMSNEQPCRFLRALAPTPGLAAGLAAGLVLARRWRRHLAAGLVLARGWRRHLAAGLAVGLAIALRWRPRRRPGAHTALAPTPRRRPRVRPLTCWVKTTTLHFL